MAPDTPLLIGELASRLGLNPKTIRYYEEIGLLPEPERSDGGYRRYGEDDEKRLRFVRGVRRLGFALGEIREVLGLRDRGEPPCGYVTELLDQRAAEVDAQIAELERLKDELADLRRRAGRLRPEDCGPVVTATSSKTAVGRSSQPRDERVDRAIGSRRRPYAPAASATPGPILVAV